MSIEQQFSIMIDPHFLRDEKRPGRLMTPENYIRSVQNVLARINATASGKTLLNSIRWHNQKRQCSVRIEPHQEQNLTSADAQPGTADDKALNDAGRIINRWFGWQLKPIKASVRFFPIMCASGPTCLAKFTSANDFVPTPESVLFHELVHVLRYLSGHNNGSQPKMRAGFNHAEGEEFIAVVATNIFDSEIGGTLRGSYPDFGSLHAGMSESFEFFKISTKAFQLIETFCKQNRGFTGAIAKVKVPFNPIAAYFKDPEKARRISYSENAVERDMRGIPASDASIPLEQWHKLLDEKDAWATGPQGRDKK